MSAIINATTLPVHVVGSIYHTVPYAIEIGITAYTSNRISIPSANPIFADVVGYLFVIVSPPLHS